MLRGEKISPALKKPKRLAVWLLLPIMLAACSASPASDQRTTPSPIPTATHSLGPVLPPVPGTPAGLPDDRLPISETSFAKNSAQGAANVVQSYFALIEAGKYAEAHALWSDGDLADGLGSNAFAASFARYSEYHAQIGAPGKIEGAAGSAYVEVPVVAYGRLKSGEPFNLKGAITLRRCNDVPGCTAEQREWRIEKSDLAPVPAGANTKREP